MRERSTTASVQPAHLVDARDATDRLWPGRGDRCFAFRWMLDDGVTLALGSDAPVAPLDPWLAIAAAVHRTVDGREPWYAEQAITLFGVTKGYFDDVEVKRALAFEVALRSHVKSKYKDLFDRIETTKDMNADDEKALVAAIEDFKKNGAY